MRGPPPTDRRRTLLQGLDLAATRGLEIGPLHNPILLKSEARVLYVDHVGTDALRRKYAGDPNVPAGRIVEVDVVWNGGRLDEAVGHQRFDYVVASHVIEHVPDLIGWLAELKAVLHPCGTVRLIVPDRRYCFDFRRESSAAADVILAARERATIPGPRQILDFMLNIAPLDLSEAWSGGAAPDPAPSRHDYQQALAVVQHALAERAYHDVHCWAFTPLSFARLMRQLAAYGLLGFACTQCTETAAGSLDFFVHLMPTDDEPLVAGSWNWAVARQASERQASEQRGSDAERGLRAELEALRRSRSWRLTAPLRGLAAPLRGLAGRAGRWRALRP